MIGRIAETKELSEAFASDQSEFVAIYGRRRVGKTFLVNETFSGQYAFQHAGVENVSMREQLEYFRQSISLCGGGRCPSLANWRTAFFELRKLLMKLPEGKKVVFIDEVPWLDTPKSGFIPAFEHFWNGWASLRKDILLVICGSATSWIVNKILYSRGGLHNRVTRPIPVAPFTLKECEEYATWKRLPFDRRQIAESYMALGGVAYYWSLMSPELSAVQNMDRLFFNKGAKLSGEFHKLFASLFRHDGKYVEIVTLLSERRHGMTLEEIKKRTSSDGGAASRRLRELEECGFIRRNPVLGAVKKDALYQLMDNFTLFHFKFLANNRQIQENFWQLSQDKPSVNAWRGLSFERLCFWHIPQIKRALGISGMLANVCSWRAKCDAKSAEDAQIDMLIDRDDRVINVCEMKFTSDKFTMTEAESRKLRQRIERFRAATGTRKGIMPTLICSAGLKRNAHSSIITQEVTLDDLFL